MMVEDREWRIEDRQRKLPSTILDRSQLRVLRGENLFTVNLKYPDP
jgi:hypothetical protein